MHKFVSSILVLKSWYEDIRHKIACHQNVAYVVLAK